MDDCVLVLQNALKAASEENDRLYERLTLQPMDLQTLGTKLDAARRRIIELEHYWAISSRVVQEQWDKIRDMSDKLRDIRENHSTNHYRVLRAAGVLREYVKLEDSVCQGITRAMLIAADDVKE